MPGTKYVSLLFIIAAFAFHSPPLEASPALDPAAGLMSPVYYSGNLPDTILIKSEPVTPGGTLNLTFEIRLHTENVGGIFMGLQNLPLGVKTTDGDWYSWSEDLGKPLSDASIVAFPKLDDGLISVVLAGVNVTPLKKYGILKSTSGEILKLSLKVPDNAAPGVYQPEPAAELNRLLPWPITDTQFIEFPVVVISPVVIRDSLEEGKQDSLEKEIIEPKTWDFNNDGKASISDVLCFLAKLSDLTGYSTALDWNGDGVCNTDDAVALFNEIRANTVSTAVLAAAGNDRDGEITELSLEKKLAIEKLVKEMNLDIEDEAALCAALFGGGNLTPRLPRAFALKQNTPNPFNPSTTINFQIPAEGAVHLNLKVYDLRGRIVRTLADGPKEAGEYSVFWDGTFSNGRKAASGIYFYKLTAGTFHQTRKMVLLK